jgi:NAD(P)-dependent dehydrogenase (short-subunit alcohol dehydrogenase family)
MPNVLIIGASRGIGLALTVEYLKRGWDVIATERQRSRDLHTHGATVLTADVTDPASIHAIIPHLTRPLDLLFVVAGIWGPRHQSPALANAAEIAAIFHTNAAGPVAAAEILAPHVARDGTFAFMTSGMGSITRTDRGGGTLYRGSKAALNMMAKAFALGEVGGRTVRVLDPGWVKTEMGGPGAAIDAETSAKGLADTLEREAGKGGFDYVNWRSERVPV